MPRSLGSDGFTLITPSGDSRLIYVSNDGNDTNAAAVHGRGYYLPSDPEIGPDPLNPVGPIVAYSSPFEAFRKVRGIGWVETYSDGSEVYERATRDALLAASSGGWPDWLLFRRGDTFTRIEDPDIGNANIGDSFANAKPDMMKWTYGSNPPVYSPGGARYEGGGISGRNSDEPFVVAAWGPASDPRPVFHGGFTVHGRLRDAVVSSLDIQPSPDPTYPGNRYGLNFGNPPESAYGAWRNVLVEDCRSQGHGMISIQQGGPSTNLILRRCVYADGWNAGGHNSSPFNGLSDGAKLTFEECVFDKNGYKENPNDASKWTATYVSSLSPGGADGLGEQGTGVQPTRTWFDRNWYMAGAAGDTLVLRGNLVARTGGGAEQLRSGGLLHKNTFLFCHDGVLYGAPEDSYGVHDSLSVQNLHLHDDLFLPPGGWGMNNIMRGGNAILSDNIYAHVHERIWTQNGPGSFFMWNVRNYEVHKKALLNSVIYHRIPTTGFSTQRSLESLDHPIAIIKNNRFAFKHETPPGADSYGYGAIARTTYSDQDTINNNMYLGNSESKNFLQGYAAGARGIKANKTFAEWQQFGFDTESSMESDWETFKNSAEWTDPDRDIVSYMQLIDPNYVTDENVRVDYGVKVQQPQGKMVKDVLPDSSYTAEQKILAAKRFHAALTFLYRARENRKGNWNSNYTSEALNNYIRQGFGKSLIDNEYNLKLSDAMTLLDQDVPPTSGEPTLPDPTLPTPTTPEPTTPTTPEPEPEPTTPTTGGIMENNSVSLEVLNNTSINKVITKSENNVCNVDLYENETLVTKIETSSSAEYVFLKVTNMKQVSETIQFTLSPDQQNKTIKFTSCFEQPQ